MEGDDDICAGMTTGSDSWEDGATVNSLPGDTFSHDNNMHGNRFNVSFTTRIHNLFHEFGEPWLNHAILDPVVYGTVL